MEDSKQIIEEAKQGAEAILQEAREEAARIIEEAKKHAEGIDYQRVKLKECLHREYLFEMWPFFDPISKKEEWDLKHHLQANRKHQREHYERCPINAVTWKVKAPVKKLGCDMACTKSMLSNPMYKLGISGVNLIESAFENLVRKTISTIGLKQGKKALLDIVKEVEQDISFYGYDVRIAKGYVALKQEELELLYYLDRLKKEAKERIRQQKEEEREEKKAQKEFERELKRAQKDEEEARKALEKAQLEAAKQQADKEKYAKLQEQIAKLELALKEAEERGQRVMSMAQQTRRGWVYVISNIGSFGEGVYKIGLTRRLDPMERVYELGDASVPFPFDVHAFIFSEDAPALETALHQAFEKQKLNTVNGKKEFFRVPLEKIERKVHELGYDIEFERRAYAPQYRDSIATV